MRHYPHLPRQSEQTKKEFWMEAYLAALHRVDAKAAEQEADEALKRCDEKWQHRSLGPSVAYWHDYPVGINPGPEQVLPEDVYDQDDEWRRASRAPGEECRRSG